MYKIITKTASCESVSDVRKANAARKYGSVNFSLVLEHNSRHMLYLSGLYPKQIKYFIKFINVTIIIEKISKLIIKIGFSKYFFIISYNST